MSGFKNQMELVKKHQAKAEQCMEYGKLEDASVHLAIATILNNGLNAKERELPFGFVQN
jgi:hypothetical protein